MRFGYVYLIGNKDSGPIKIGHATQLKQRLNALQVGNPAELSILHSESVPWTLAPSVEKAVQGQFEEKHVRGEWYAVPLCVLRNSLTSIAAAYSTARSERDDFSREICIALCRRPMQARYAVSAYRNCMTRDGTKPFIAGINRRLLETAGQAAYIMFQMAIVENRDMTTRFTNRSRIARQAEASLIQALDTLTDIWDQVDIQWRSLDVHARISA